MRFDEFNKNDKGEKLDELGPLAPLAVGAARLAAPLVKKGAQELGKKAATQSKKVLIKASLQSYLKCI